MMAITPERYGRSLVVLFFSSVTMALYRKEKNDKEMESCYPLYLTMTSELRNVFPR